MRPEEALASSRTGAASKAIEWPPDSGRVARYIAAELRHLRGFIERLDGVRHRDGCPAGSAHFDRELRDLDGCEFCRLLNEIEVLHEFKVVFGISLDLEVAPQSILTAGDALADLGDIEL
jgi:hypothetical protein